VPVVPALPAPAAPLVPAPPLPALPEVPALPDPELPARPVEPPSGPMGVTLPHLARDTTKINEMQAKRGPRVIRPSWHFFPEPSAASSVPVVMKRPDRLASLDVVEPCPVAWSSMTGDEQVRFCGKCRQNVYNVAALTRAEALALIERAEGGVCVRLTRRPDGTIATGDCWAALRRARRRGLLALAVALPAIVLAQLWSHAFGLRALYGMFHRPPAPVATEFQAIPELPAVEAQTSSAPPPAKPETKRHRPKRPQREDWTFVAGRMKVK
jgi:hypothetical protein